MTTAPDGGPAKTSPAAMLTDTIGRVAVVEHRVSQLGGDLAEIGAGQDDVQRGVASLQEQISGVYNQLAVLTAEAQEAEPDETTLVDWSSLTRAEALREWDRLYLWLDTLLVPTYEITVTQLRPCWTHHPAVREELSWLRVCWAQAYRRAGSSGAAAGEWHARWLPNALDRVEKHFERRGCTLGKHGDQHLPEEIRTTIKSDDLAEMKLWLNEGRDDDIQRRH